jgi:hypothetical protein
MTNQIDDYAKRPIRYRNIDGLSELAIGLLWVLAPLLEIFTKTAPSGSLWHGKTPLLVCFAALACVVVFGPKALKKRLTYPRTGYVKYRRTRSRVWRLAGGVLAAAVVALAAAFLLRRYASPSSKVMLIALTSAGWGGIYAGITRLDAAWRWVALGVLVVAPPAVTALPLHPVWRDGLPIIALGLVFLVSGAISLALYLRRNPVPEQAAE